MASFIILVVTTMIVGGIDNQHPRHGSLFWWQLQYKVMVQISNKRVVSPSFTKFQTKKWLIQLITDPL
jgi:hypothetical protein